MSERAHHGIEDGDPGERGAEDDVFIGEEAAVGDTAAGFEGEHGERGREAPDEDPAGPM